MTNQLEDELAETKGLLKNILATLGACPRIENLLQKSWIWCFFPLILVK